MTRRTPFTGTASSRRRARRVHLQREANLSVEVVSCPDPDHVTLQYKCPAANRVDKAVETETGYHKQILASAVKYVEQRMSSKYQKVCNEAGRQISAVQKPYKRSMPLI